MTSQVTKVRSNAIKPNNKHQLAQWWNKIIGSCVKQEKKCQLFLSLKSHVINGAWELLHDTTENDIVPFAY